MNFAGILHRSVKKNFFWSKKSTVTATAITKKSPATGKRLQGTLGNTICIFGKYYIGVVVIFGMCGLLFFAETDYYAVGIVILERLNGVALEG